MSKKAVPIPADKKFAYEVKSTGKKLRIVRHVVLSVASKTVRLSRFGGKSYAVWNVSSICFTPEAAVAKFLKRRQTEVEQMAASLAYMQQELAAAEAFSRNPPEPVEPTMWSDEP